MSLYSLKMRASHNGEHVSGAEKIIERCDISEYTNSLINRGLYHAKGEADFINIKLEKVDTENIIYLNALPVKTIDVNDYHEGIEQIRIFLTKLGIDKLDDILELFKETYSMRGAMLLDINSLERLEPDKGRGIRATYMDMERSVGQTIPNTKNHFMEAIVLATKVANAPGIVGEICISDDPDYVTGYVCTKDIGYMRITRMKQMGDPAGGRIFLYNGKKEDVQKTIDYLEKQRVIVRNVVFTDDLKSSVYSTNPDSSETKQALADSKNTDKLFFIDDELNKMRENSLYRCVNNIDSMQSSHVSYNGKDMLMLASNSYLDMIGNQEVREYTCHILKEYGAGSGGSRLTTGSTIIHKQLENKIAEFKETEAAIVFNTGYVANLAVISALLDKDDIVFSDELNHASIIDGCRLSKARIVVYKHNDMADLEKKLKENPCKKGMLVSDAVFSMDGDILNLPEFVALGDKYGLITMIDEAHSTGVIGKTGKGIMEYYEYSCKKPDIMMGTLSKAIGSEGGFVCSEKKVIEYLINKARGYIFSTSLSPVTMAASYMGICVLEKHPELSANLQENTRIFCAALKKYGVEAHSDTAIVPIILGDEAKAMACQEKLMNRGYYISAIRYPTVKKGQARLRVALMSSHTAEELEAAAKAIAETINEVSDL